MGCDKPEFYGNEWFKLVGRLFCSEGVTFIKDSKIFNETIVPYQDAVVKWHRITPSVG
jgi:hypothetical protein